MATQTTPSQLETVAGEFTLVMTIHLTPAICQRIYERWREREFDDWLADDTQWKLHYYQLYPLLNVARPAVSVNQPNSDASYLRVLKRSYEIELEATKLFKDWKQHEQTKHLS